MITLLMVLVVALLGLPSATAAGAPARVATPTMRTYPLQARSTAAQLGSRGRARLPAIRVWATGVLGRSLDQSAGLMEVQTVSALHIRRAFYRRLGPDAAAKAIRIAWRESRLLPNVVNDTNSNHTMDWGLFQLNDGGTLQYVGGTPGMRPLRPRWNARAAARLVIAVGWSPWELPAPPPDSD